MKNAIIDLVICFLFPFISILIICIAILEGIAACNRNYCSPVEESNDITTEVVGYPTDNALLTVSYCNNTTNKDNDN